MKKIGAMVVILSLFLSIGSGLLFAQEEKVGGSRIHIQEDFLPPTLASRYIDTRSALTEEQLELERKKEIWEREIIGWGFLLGLIVMATLIEW